MAAERVGAKRTRADDGSAAMDDDDVGRVVKPRIAARPRRLRIRAPPVPHRVPCQTLPPSRARARIYVPLRIPAPAVAALRATVAADPAAWVVRIWSMAADYGWVFDVRLDSDADAEVLDACTSPFGVALRPRLVGKHGTECVFVMDAERPNVFDAVAA